MSCNDVEKSLAFWYSGFQNLRAQTARSFSNTLVKGGRSKLEISIYRVLQRPSVSRCWRRGLEKTPRDLLLASSSHRPGSCSGSRERRQLHRLHRFLPAPARASRHHASTCAFPVGKPSYLVLTGRWATFTHQRCARVGHGVPIRRGPRTRRCVSSRRYFEERVCSWRRTDGESKTP